MAICPVCKGFMATDDVDRANHVALGFAVCSWDCHTRAYDPEQFELPLRMHADVGWRHEIRSHIDDP